MIIRHRKCGAVYTANKTAFLNGAFCPVCTPRYNAEDVVHAIRSCTYGDVVIQPTNYRGSVSVAFPDGKRIPHVSFRSLMNDMSASKPKLIPYRKYIYHPPETERHMIYMSVKKAEEKTGYWTFQDGIANEKGEPIPIDRRLRNHIQKMAKSRLLIRISTGKYRTANEYDCSI